MCYDRYSEGMWRERERRRAEQAEKPAQAPTAPSTPPPAEEVPEVRVEELQTSGAH